MKVYETAKFQKQRKKLRSDSEMTALKGALRSVAEDPLSGKKLKGEFKDLRELEIFRRGAGKTNHLQNRGKRNLSSLLRPEGGDLQVR